MLSLNHWIYDYNHKRGYVIHRENGIDNYSILLFCDPVELWQEGKMQLIEKNSVVFFDRFAKQLYYNNQSDYSHHGIFFSGEDILPILKEINLPLNRAFTVKDCKQVARMISDIGEEAVLKEKFSDCIIDLKIKQLLYKIADLTETNGGNSYSYYEKIKAIRTDILRRPNEQYNIKDIAASLHISVSRFQHLYKDFFASTLTSDIIDSRISSACHLLTNRECSVQEIAEMCGYSCIEHFLRQFKARMGVSPTEYRKQHAARTSSGKASAD